jgi:hypothetical protein
MKKKTRRKRRGEGSVWFINNINLKHATKSYNIFLNMQWKVIMVIVCEVKLWFLTIVNFFFKEYIAFDIRDKLVHIENTKGHD